MASFARYSNTAQPPTPCSRGILCGVHERAGDKPYLDHSHATPSPAGVLLAPAALPVVLGPCLIVRFPLQNHSFVTVASRPQLAMELCFGGHLALLDEVTAGRSWPQRFIQRIT